MAGLNPTPDQVAAKVPELRQLFKEKYADKLDKYDPRDMKRFNEDDAYTRLFLRTLHSKGDPEKALPAVHESLAFRKEWQINDLNASAFPPKFAEDNGMYYKGHDKDKHPILYMDVKRNSTKNADEVVLLKKYIAWHFDQHAAKDPETMCVVLLDMSGASVGNVSIDITKFIISCFTWYFPTYLAYLVNYEMPLLLAATWKIISAFLSSEQKQKLLMLKKKDLKNYIPEAGKWWDHMQEKEKEKK